MQNVALAWLVIELSGSPLAIGALAFWRFVPFTIFGLVAGVVADRIESRKLVMATQASAMVISIALAVVTLTDTATLPIVYVLAALGGVALAFDAPGRQSLTFQMVGPRELPNAVALNSGLFNGSRVIGPAIAGVVIATVGTGLCFVINAVSFLAVLTALAIVREEELRPIVRDPSTRVIEGLRRGFAYAWNDPQLRLILTVVTVVATVGFNFHVLVPLLAADTLHVGPEGFGLLSASFGLGALDRRARDGHLPRGELAPLRRRHGVVRRPRSPSRPRPQRVSRGDAALRNRHRFHALHGECERARAARRARPPAWTFDRSLPVRVPRARARSAASSPAGSRRSAGRRSHSRSPASFLWPRSGSRAPPAAQGCPRRRSRTPGSPALSRATVLPS